MWRALKDASALVIQEPEALTLLEGDGTLRRRLWTGKDTQTVLREQDVLVRSTDVKTGGIVLSRLDRSDLRMLGQRELYKADRLLEPAFRGIQSSLSPQDCLTAEYCFRVSFQPPEETGRRAPWELEEQEVNRLWLSWTAVDGGQSGEWQIGLEDVRGNLPGGWEESLSYISGLETMLASGTQIYLLVKGWTTKTYRNLLLEADLDTRECRILWAQSDGDGIGARYDGFPRVLDPEQGVQWTLARPEEVGGFSDESTGRELPLTARGLEPNAPVLKEKPVWRDIPVAWPNQFLMWKGMLWMEWEGFYGYYRDGTFTKEWFAEPEEDDLPPGHRAHWCGLWQGRLVFRFDDGSLAAAPAQLEPPAPREIRWLRRGKM